MAVFAVIVVFFTLGAMVYRHDQLAPPLSHRSFFAWTFAPFLLVASCIWYSLQGDKRMSVLLGVLIVELMIILTVIVVRASVA